ncbi:hypothetical protein TWF506_009533 [Arthrobotrys conoides]|uniref:DC-UbP/UBTD2 N-terminal domain-containing protein n=1 Tax=Arthrobotrys conoides TaxID=74498 RepID=A0AAN8N2E4_9PEZI
MGGCLSTGRRRRRRGVVPLSQRLDVPLKRPKKWTYNTENGRAPPTISSLQRQRDDFWFTQVTGIPEVWSTIRSICEMLMTDDSDEQLATAREMLSAAEITLPNGSFDGGAWDKSGNKYVVPIYIINNPINVRPASPARNSTDSWESSESGKASMAGGQGPRDSVTTISYMVQFRILYGSDCTDLTMQVWSDEKLKTAAKRLLRNAGLSTETHKVSMVMDGKPFDLKKKLGDPAQPSWLANRIVQVFIRQTIEPQSPPSPADPNVTNDPLLVPLPPPPPSPPPAGLSAQPEAGSSMPSAENEPGPSRRGRSADSKSSGESQTPTLVSNTKTV